MDIVDVACKDHGDEFDIGDDFSSYGYRLTAEAVFLFVGGFLASPIVLKTLEMKQSVDGLRELFDKHCKGMNWARWIPLLPVNKVCNSYNNLENEIITELNNQMKLVVAVIISALTGVNLTTGENYADKIKNILNTREKYVCMLAKAIKATVEKFSSCSRKPTVDPKDLLKM